MMAPLITFGVLVLVTFGINSCVGNVACNSKAQAFPHNFGIIQGCMISTDGGKTYIPLENYRVL